MRELPLVSNNTTFQKEWWNDVAKELQNTVLTTDMVLDEFNNYQLSETMGRYAAAADFYTDTGGANNYILSLPYSKVPTSYINGMRVRFKALNSNTGDSFVNINNIGIMQIRKYNGTQVLDKNDIIQNEFCELIYNASIGCFDLIPIVKFIRGKRMLQTIFQTRYLTFSFYGAGEFIVNGLDLTVAPKASNSILEYEVESCLYAQAGKIYNGFPNDQNNTFVALNAKISGTTFASNYSAERAALNSHLGGEINHSSPFVIKGIYNNMDLTDKTFNIYASGSYVSSMFGYDNYIGSCGADPNNAPHLRAISTIKVIEYSI